MDIFRIGALGGRLGQPVEQAHAILFLASDEAASISAQCLYVEGSKSQG
jgi:NAD(P)-dependent dehydrogenase (short-subunit alcohol dehydrogenase family)